jgi:hypothetical protein
MATRKELDINESFLDKLAEEVRGSGSAVKVGVQTKSGKVTGGDLSPW